MSHHLYNESYMDSSSMMNPKFNKNIKTYLNLNTVRVQCTVVHSTKVTL